MNRPRNPFAALTLLVIAVLACNLPSGGPNPQQTASVPTQPGSTPILLATETFTPVATFTITLTPTITPTFTPSVPMVTVSQNTNCRTGPGQAYDIVGGLLVGESAEVVGKYQSGSYWVIKNPDSSGNCWLWGNYATVSGNTASLPEMSPPPTPTPTIPDPPKDLEANKVCIPVPPGAVFQYTGTITWKDQSDNEDGFHIYFNGGLFATVGPDITVYPLPGLPFPAGTAITMGVDSYNVTGKSVTKSITIVCP
jgi:hypothetical protein